MSTFLIRQRGRHGGDSIELAANLPMRATTITCLPDPSGQQQFWCAQLDEPVIYRLVESFDRRRCQPEFLDIDSVSEFLWVMVVVVWASDPSEHLHPGMHGLEVQVAYVVDQTLGRDAVFDATKVEVIGGALVDDLGPAADPPEQHTEQPDHGAEWSPDSTDRGAPSVTDAESFHHQLNRMIAALTTLTGLHPGRDIPEQTWGEVDDSPGRSMYQIAPNSLRYYRFDPTDGWQWITARDLDDLLYRVVDDTARVLAWRWSERAPMAAAGTPRREVIARGFWSTLMAALDADQVDRLLLINDSHNLPGQSGPT